MKNYTRAQRRHHRQRRLHKIKYYFVCSPGDANNRSHVVRRLNAVKPCSCVMCGNPRRYFNELTIQEQKHSLAYEFTQYIEENF